MNYSVLLHLVLDLLVRKEMLMGKKTSISYSHMIHLSERQKHGQFQIGGSEKERSSRASHPLGFSPCLAGSNLNVEAC